MSDSPLDKLAVLGQLLKQKAAEIGLEMQTFVSIPDLHGGPHVIQGIFLMDVEIADAATDDASDLDKALAGILQATKEQEVERLEELKRSEQEEKAQRARDRLLEMREKLERGEGLF